MHARFFVAILVSLIGFIGLVPTRAQLVYDQGYYEFEDVAPGLYTGAWSTVTVFGPGVTVMTTSSGSVQFNAEGQNIVIWRLLRPTGVAATMRVCINVVICNVVSNETSGSVAYMHPVSFPLPAGTATVFIERVTGSIHLDSFMILEDPEGTFPTPVPTATILPSSTPASTTTPQPTPTPQPTATALQFVWAIDPARRYGYTNGEISAFSYDASAADIHIANLLSLLLFSIWGFFIFCVFVLVKYKVGKK